MDSQELHSVIAHACEIIENNACERAELETDDARGHGIKL